MIGSDDGTSISDSKNLLLDKAEFCIVGRSLEQLADRPGYVVLMISGSMGMARRDFKGQIFFRLPGPSGKGVPMHLDTSFADCKESENLEHFISSYCIVPSVSRVGNDSGNQILLNIANVSLAIRCEDIEEAARCRQGGTHGYGISHSCRCFTPLRQILVRFTAHIFKLKGKFKVVSSAPCRQKE
jgi:hypothetical protein